MNIVRVPIPALALAIVFASGTPSLPAQSLCNPNATSNTRAVYEYLKDVGRAGSLILGQHAGHGSTITRPSLDPGIGGTYDSNCFANYVEPIFAQTGKWPGMLSIDYEFNYPRVYEGYNGLNPGDPRTHDGNPATSLKDPNLKLKEWWQAGGLVTINWSPANPWAVSPPQNYGVLFGNEKLGELTDSSLPVGQRWLARLDEIALALDDLQNAGVVVLFRPMQEMDFYGWWPGNRVVNGQGDQFRAVWRHLYHYLTDTKGLNNLIWVFSPTYAVAPWVTTSTGTGALSGAYPGNDCVDLVAFTAYGTSLGQRGGAANLNAAGVAAMIAHGKPIGIGEAGHLNNDTAIDNVDYLNFAKENFPTASYIVLWQPYPDTVNGEQGVKLDGWVKNRNLAGAFNDPRAVDRASIAYAGTAFVPNDPATTFTTKLAGALTATAAAGSSSAAAAIDGNQATCWDSGTNPPETGTWLTVDLGSAKTVGRVKITWCNEDQRARSYRVQTRADQAPWLDLSVQNYRTNGTEDDLTFPARAAGRLIRILMQKSNGNPRDGYKIRELELYEANLGLPVRPTGLRATVTASNTQVDLAWRDNSSNETGFKVEQRIAGGAWTALPEAAANASTRTITGLTPQAAYSFRVRATNPAGDSAPSNQVTAVIR